jgi:hypothetical protein
VESFGGQSLGVPYRPRSHPARESPSASTIPKLVSPDLDRAVRQRTNQKPKVSESKPRLQIMKIFSKSTTSYLG